MGESGDLRAVNVLLALGIPPPTCYVGVSTLRGVLKLEGRVVLHKCSRTEILVNFDKISFILNSKICVCWTTSIIYKSIISIHCVS